MITLNKDFSDMQLANMQINALTSLCLALAIGGLGCFQVGSTFRNATTVEQHIKELRKNVSYRSYLL